ncbi:MAG: AAA family ATPase [Gemmatimonadota bacterium]|nr:AAA family ATPase [Gemmatimonadota bacterium]
MTPPVKGRTRLLEEGRGPLLEEVAPEVAALVSTVTEAPATSEEAQELLFRVREVLDPGGDRRRPLNNRERLQYDAVAKWLNRARVPASRKLGVRWVDEICDTEPPERVLWRDALEGDVGASVLAVGEVGILSGPGKSGKGTIAAALAAVGATGGGAVCGLRIGPRVPTLLSYEDPAYRVRERVWWHAQGKDAPEVAIVADPPPLFAVEGKHGDDFGGVTVTDTFRKLRGHIAENGTDFLVLDPIADAVPVGHATVGVARGVMRHLRQLAREYRLAVLAVAHDTKSARNEARLGLEVGAGAVAGSAAWSDAARSVLYLWRDPKRSGRFLLECLHANYGPDGWAGNLRETDPWRGLEAVPGRETLAREKVAERRSGGKSKTDAERDAQIVALHEDGVTQAGISKRLRVSRRTVGRVLQRQSTG